MTEREALDSLAEFVATMFRDKDEAWAFEVRDVDLHAVCVRFSDEEDLPDVLGWIETRMDGDSLNAAGFFLPGGADQVAMLVVKAPHVNDPVSAELGLKDTIARRRRPVLVLNRPGRVLH